MAPQRFAWLVIRQVRWIWLLVPPALLVVGGLVFRFVTEPSEGIKESCEVIAVVLLWTALAVAIIRTVTARSRFMAWIAVLVAALVFREHHLMNSATTVTCIVFLVLFIIAWIRSDRYLPHLTDRRNVTLLAMIALTYALTQTLDTDTFKLRDMLYVVLEEVLEVVGHVLVLVLACTAQVRCSTSTQLQSISDSSTARSRS